MINYLSTGEFSAEILHVVIFAISLVFLFRKLGIKEYNAFIPFRNYYLLARAVDAESEGRVAVVSGIMLYTFDIIDYIIEIASIPISSFTDFLVDAFVVVLPFIYALYLTRLYLKVIEKFGRKRIWILVWVFADVIAVLIFGLCRSFVLKKEDKENSGADFNDMSEGFDLSIALRSRTVIDFFRKKTLLRDIDITIPKGHMVLLLGGSGAGKTTFLNAVTGYEKADAEIKIGGNDIYKDYRHMKYDIGFVPQLDLMRGNDTVYRTVSDAASIRLPKNMTESNRKMRIEGVLNKFGLWPVRKNLVEKLSGGQRKRLSIAMEYISNPSLFILDEPDSGLDGVVARELFESLRSIADTNKIVMVITHTPDRVIDLFDDVIVLAKDSERTGRLAYYGSVNEAYSFFGKNSMEEILLSINQKDEGGEGRAEEFVAKYRSLVSAGEGASV